MKKKITVFLILIVIQSFLSKAQDKISSFKINSTTILAETIKNGIMIPYDSYNKLIRSEQNNYILFNSLNTNALLLKADIVKENFSLEANRFSKSVPNLAYGAKIQADYSNSSKNEAVIYSEGKFINNLKYEGNIKYFLDVSDKFGNITQKRKDYLSKKLDDLVKIWDEKATVLVTIQKLNERLQSLKGITPQEIALALIDLAILHG